MTALPSAELLQKHYETNHLEPGANYMCPVCKARMASASDLELHYSQNHSSEGARAKGGADSDEVGLKLELSAVSLKWNEERRVSRSFASSSASY